MHEPTKPAHREAVLRDQAERLLRDAATWGYRVEVMSAPATGFPETIRVIPDAQKT